LWSVLSRKPDRAREFAKTHRAQSPSPAYADLDALVADPELDAVIIATPDKLHAEQAVVCAKAKKHVLAEKPLATDVESAKAIVDACETAGVRLGVAYHLHWHEGHRKLNDIIQNNGIGPLRHMRAHWSFNAPDASNWRAHPEVGRWWSMAGVGTHCLDFIRWVMVPGCGEIVSVTSTISRDFFKGPHDETAIVSMKFESGATAVFSSSVLFQSPSRAEIYGADGYAICDQTLGPKGAGFIFVRDDKLDFEVKNPYVGEIEDFVSAIRQGRPPEVDGVEGIRNVELLVEADDYRS
jgi:1,5-anhydro-D-fructose reductase (1,5-anhydro-D-mannitol-forming)